jgi:hypothetical protein
MLKTYNLPNAKITIRESGISMVGHISRLSAIELRKIRKLYKRKRLPARLIDRVQELKANIKYSGKSEHDVVVWLKPTNVNVKLTAQFGEHQLRFGEALKDLVVRAKRKHRKNNKLLPFRHTFKGFTFDFTQSNSGRVFFRPNQVFEQYIAKKLKDLYAEKRPQDQTKYVGIELEFCAPIKEPDLAIKLFQAGMSKFAQLKTDGSLRPQGDETAFELALLLKESSYKRDLKQVCQLLADVNAVVVDRRCGLHVHLDMRRRNKDVVFSNLVSCQKVLKAIIDPRRNENEFCRTVTSKKFPTRFTGTRQERYKTINAAAYYKFKTLEVRMHQGSLDYKEISNWIDLLVKIANHKVKIKSNVSELTNLRKRIKLKDKIYSDLIDKTCYWQVNGNLSQPVNVAVESALRTLVPWDSGMEQPTAAEAELETQ